MDRFKIEPVHLTPVYNLFQVDFCLDPAKQVAEKKIHRPLFDLHTVFLGRGKVYGPLSWRLLFPSNHFFLQHYRLIPTEHSTGCKSLYQAGLREESAFDKKSCIKKHRRN